MLTFLSISSIICLIYLYNYDKSKLDTLYNYLHNFSSDQNNEKVGNTINNENNDIEIGIADEYDMTDKPIEAASNTNDYYDSSFSTDFVEKLPIINRFYSFTKKKDDRNDQTI